MEKKKIIVFYGSQGGGHLSAAKALKEELDLREDTESILVDGLNYVAPIINKISVSFYITLSTNAHKLWETIYQNSNQEKSISDVVLRQTLKLYRIKMYRLLKKEKPTHIVCTHPFPAIICAHIARKGKIDIPISTVLTDFEVHSQWCVLNDYIKNYFVATEEMKEELIERGIQEDKVLKTGIPIRKVFGEELTEEEKLKIKRENNLPEDKKLGLLFGGGAVGLAAGDTTDIIFDFVEGLKDYHFIVITGKNEKLYSDYETKLKEKGIENVTLLSFTDKVADFMKISDFAVSKPGGLTTSELLAVGKPIFMVNPIPGQEDANRRYIESKEAGLLVTKGNVELLIDRILKDKGYIERLSENSKTIGNGDSSRRVIDKVLGG